MLFRVYDIDKISGDTIVFADLLGYTECKLAEIVSNKTITKTMRGDATITIHAEEVVGESKVDVMLQFEASKLDNKDVFGKSDPYLKISKQTDEGSFAIVYRTQHKDNTLNPKWKPFSVSLQKLCSSNYDLKLKIMCYDHDDDGGHDLIGECYTTMAQLATADSVKLQWDLINPKKMKKKSGYKNSGVLMLESIKVTPVFSFLDYVMSGCQINFTVGIDFTGSNGPPTSPTSLHYMNPNEPNQYVKSLIAVGEICQDYDTDKMFPALGFGAKIPPAYEVSFQFPLNFNPTNPYCQGIYGIVAAYQNCIPQIQLWGPTNVAPIINHIATFAQSIILNQENVASNYFILLLLTDGEITDMADTIDAIVEASYLPISVIIVGVGDADFSAMELLDCDKGKLRSRGGKDAFRDIVQFVPFRQFKSSRPGELAKVVLAEVPKQVSEYYMLREIKPNVQEQMPITAPLPQLT